MRHYVVKYMKTSPVYINVLATNEDEAQVKAEAKLDKKDPEVFHQHILTKEDDMMEVPDYGDIYTIEEFRDQCKLTCFVDDDGSGNFVKLVKGKYYYIPCDVFSPKDAARPSAFYHGTAIIPKDATHVAWFNK